MLSKLFKSPVRVEGLRGSPAGPLLEGFAHKLCQAGYAEATAKRHIGTAEHFIYWTDRKGIEATSLNGSVVEMFEHHLHRCRCPGYSRAYAVNRQNGARLFLRYLFDSGAATESATAQTATEPVLLTAFHQWMRHQRGTSTSTLANYNVSIRGLLKSVGDDPRRFDAQNLRKFVLERSRQSGWGAAKLCVAGVRMFLRFLAAEGQCPTGLDACIPALANWRLSSLPRYLGSGDVERVIGACDSATPLGCRDRAILLLLARMGFRAGDIVQLCLDDIDWEQAWIYVSGKGRRQTRLPLTQEVGDAIAAYLQHGRPLCVTDKLFIRSRAPFRAFTTYAAICAIVKGAMRRARVTPATRGAAHILRHYLPFLTMSRDEDQIQAPCGIQAGE